MKTLKPWDTYVSEALTGEERSIQLPLTEHETFVIPYPSRKQGKQIAEAQKVGDTDGLLIGLLGEEAGARVSELSADHPGYILDEFLLDVMRKFGFIEEETPSAKPAKAVEAGKLSSVRTSGTTPRKRGTTRKTSSAASN
jgi:hypothetical protein